MKRALPYLGILGLALALRAAHLVDWHATPLFSVLVGDARGYDLWARQIAAGDWFGREVTEDPAYTALARLSLEFIIEDCKRLGLKPGREHLKLRLPSDDPDTALDCPMSTRAKEGAPGSVMEV